jgi:catecholate siderophore receptor
MKRVGKRNGTHRRKKGAPPRWLVLGALAASTALVHLTPKAYAQESRQEQMLPPKKADVEETPETPDQDAEKFTETIDVTAQPAPASPKFTEPLRDTPQSIAVVPQRIIEERGATTLREVLRNVTGISLLAGEGGSNQGDNLAIRGFAAQSDIFVDGVRDFGAYTRDPFNLEQVEVAKGPASLYTGHGSTGGSVNLVSKTPHLDAFRSATAGGGTDQYGRATVDVNQPLENLPGAALRVNGMWTHADAPGRDAVENERWGIAPSIAFGLGTPTRTTLSYSHLAQDNVPDHGIPWVPATNLPLAAYANQPAPVDFDNFYGITSRDHETTETGIATAVVEHDVSDALSLRSLVRHGTSRRDAVTTSPRFLGNDSTVIRREFQSRDEEDQILAQQNDLTFRFRTGGTDHVLVTGTEVARETAKNYLRTAPAAPNTNLFDPDPDDPFIGPITRTGARTESQAETVAVYAADTVKLGEQWEINAGLRWDRFDVDFKSIAVDGAATPFGRTDQMVSWRAGLINKPRPNGSVYLAAGTSFNPSAEANNGLTLNATTADLEPERSRSYEAGTKWDFAAARLSLSAAVFQTEKVNAKTPGLLPGDPPTVLEGEQRIRGFELGASGKLTDRWSALFSYTYLDGEVTKSNNPIEAGNALANTPDHSISLWTTYRLPRGFEVGIGGQYVGERTNSTTTVRIAPAYTIYDAMVSYPVSNLLTLRLNVGNLTDERYIDRLSGGHFVPGAGRSAFLTTSFNF